MSGLEGKLDTIMKASPICARILEFLIDHEGAMDTVEGAAMCWVDSDEVGVKYALDYLVSAGLVAARPFGPRLYYSLTPDPGIRSWLFENRLRLSGGPRELRATQE